MPDFSGQRSDFRGQQEKPHSIPPAVRIEDLHVHFPVRRGVFGEATSFVKAVDGVTLSIDKGEVFALVGESGCGKTTLAMAILNLVPVTSGTISIATSGWPQGTEWSALKPFEKRAFRKSLQVVFQDPYSSLNPRMTIQSILEEPLKIHRLGTLAERKDRLEELLNQVGLSADFMDRYPHEFSGGQRQRIGIARALATRPEILVADEPVSSLDVSIQAQIINLLQDLQEAYRLSLIFISHDLAIVRHIANRVAVMYLGRIVESATTEQIFANPVHPYTQLLLSSVPVPGKGRPAKAHASSEPVAPSPQENGCPFYPRCTRASAECLGQYPQLKDIGSGHFVACVKG